MNKNIEDIDKVVESILETKKIHIGEEKEEDKFTCCGIEITGEIEDIGLCPECLEHI